MTRDAHSTHRVRARIDESMLKKHTEGFGDFVYAIRELAWNASDAGADTITIIFEKCGEKTNLHIIDDGAGVTEEGLEAIASLDMSPSAKDPGKRGKKGNVSKGFVHHSEGFGVETRRLEDTHLLSIRYTAAELVEMWNTGEAFWNKQDIPTGHYLTSSGTVVSLFNLGSGPGINQRHDRSAHRLVTELGQRLPVSLTKKITVIDEHGKQQKLKPRKFVGTRICGEGTISGIGPVSYEIAVVPNPADVEDHLELWGMEAVCDVRTFLGRVRPTPSLATLLRAVRHTLDHPQVVGQIMIPGLNAYVSNTRRDFMQGLFDDPELVFAIVSFLHQEIVPKVEKNLGRTRDESAQTDEDTFQHDLVKRLQQVGGVPRTDAPIADVDLNELSVTPARAELEPGDRMTFEITNPAENTTYTWDAIRSGGQLDRNSGTSVTYTAGKKLGPFSITVGDGTRSLLLNIEIVAELALRFATSVRHVLPRQKVTLRLINTKRTTGVFDWDATSCGGSITVAKSGLSAEYDAGEKEGEFSVTVTEKGTAGIPKRTKCTIYIAKKTTDTAPRRPSETVFRYGKYEYELQVRRFGNTPETVGSVSYLFKTVGGRPARIILNFGHPSFENQPDDVRRTQALMLVAVRIAQHELDMDGSLARLAQTQPSEIPDKIQSRAGEVLADIAKRLRRS